jgi:hypothetical protein
MIEADAELFEGAWGDQGHDAGGRLSFPYLDPAGSIRESARRR